MAVNLKKSWIEIPRDSDFPLENLPYGAFACGSGTHLGVRAGESIFDLFSAAEAGLLDGAIPRAVAQAATLNPLLESGRDVWKKLRQRILELLDVQAPLQSVNRERLLVPQSDATMKLPFACGNYVDFYSSLEHATNLGKIMRPGSDPLLPNWRWLPIGYNGRASTIVVSGTPVRRPKGQVKAQENAAPQFVPTRMLDFELEMGFVTGPGNPMGTSIPIERAADHIFGLVLVNDWSARDIQAWEYQPLGPFLGKSFATSISPWVVTLEALEPYRVAGPPQSPEPLPYLRSSEPANYDISLSVELLTGKMRDLRQSAQVISRTNFRTLYWSMAQQLAHLTSNGTSVRPGDLCASGTISGDVRASSGSLIELTLRGAEPLTLSSGEKRAFLEDGDTVIMRAGAQNQDMPRIGFGPLSGVIEA